MDGFYASEMDEHKILMVQPLVSFLMSVKNDSPKLAQCLESLANQTYKNIEAIVVLDSASLRAQARIKIAAQKNSIFRIITNPTPKNLSRSLNLGISYCNGDFIARIDADDICSLDRIATQVECITSLGEEFALVGSRAKGIYFDKNDEMLTVVTQRDFFQTNPIIHPSILVRRRVLENFRYNEKFRYSQDYELWTRIIQHHKFAILNRELIEFDVRHRNPKYVLSQEFYFLSANLKLLFTSCADSNSELSFTGFIKQLYINFIKQKNLAKNWIKLITGQF